MIGSVEVWFKSSPVGALAREQRRFTGNFTHVCSLDRQLSVLRPLDQFGQQLEQ